MLNCRKSLTKVMKVLWVTTSDTFYNSGRESKNNSYNGVGWVASQQLHLMKRDICDLAVMFPTSDVLAKNRMVDGVAYYPIVDSPGRLAKLKRYYFPDTDNYYGRVSSQVDYAIDDFKPDIVHVFGLECPLSEIVYSSNAPCIVHLQGILSACENSFFPPFVGTREVRKFGSFLRERILRNGFLHGFDAMRRGAVRERKLFKAYSNFLGRTHWDRSITALYSGSGSKYHHLNEILRPEFYNAPAREPRKKIDTLKIVSTISPTMYKGLDYILRVADELDSVGVPFQWRVIGVNEDSEYARILCKSFDININDEIDFVGKKSPEEIVGILNDSDVYLHPSYIDNSPNSVCEAQILGVPVIATNVGGVSSIVQHNETGILVPANDLQMAVTSLKQLLSDYDLRYRLSHSELSCAEKRHDPKEIIDNTILIYNSLINDAHR